MKKVIYSCLISIITLALIYLCGMPTRNTSTINNLFKVYLKGNYIGLIEHDNELYDLINEKQMEVKEKYQVDTVYPPNSFSLTKYNTYDDNVTDVKTIYDKIASEDEFTIKGYQVSIKKDKDVKSLYVLDKELFENALFNYVTAFISEEDFNGYIKGTQEELDDDIGEIIENMYFDETITIKEANINISDTIYTDITSLTQYLLFGENVNSKSYSIKEGDTISTIAEDNELNVQEFLIANPQFRDEKTLLKIGEKVNITLINPQLTFVYQVKQIEEVEEYFEKKTQIDNTKPGTYSEITQAGVVGIRKLKETYTVTNGEQQSEVKILTDELVRERVDQITTKGKKTTYYISGHYVDTGLEWGWPTNSPYRITSRFGWRWGKMHEGIDISGTGRGSQIYAAGDGVVVTAEDACKSCSRWSNGTYVVIEHANNVYTVYAHLEFKSVKVGQVITKGTKIGGMGETGYAFGVHLHFAASIGQPFEGKSVSYFNPLELYR